ncbi:hypothetical protein Holit_03134 [Hollandina sp. SP2]
MACFFEDVLKHEVKEVEGFAAGIHAGHIMLLFSGLRMVLIRRWNEGVSMTFRVCF